MDAIVTLAVPGLSWDIIEALGRHSYSVSPGTIPAHHRSTGSPRTILGYNGSAPAHPLAEYSRMA